MGERQRFTANRPTTCTTGVGYWATDQGSWNQSGQACVGNGAGAGQGCQGELFTCISTNTWSNTYTPYTYPHPLISNTPTVATPTCTPTSGAPPQTVTCSDSTSGASICYTTDGSTPTASTPGTFAGGTTLTYSGAITISTGPTTLNVLGTKAANLNSSVQSYTYTSSGGTAATPVWTPGPCFPTGCPLPLQLSDHLGEFFAGRYLVHLVGRRQSTHNLECL